MRTTKLIDFQEWIENHRELLKPPVANKLVFEHADMIVMVVGGPNERRDYHIDPVEEIFYQIEGEMVLKVVEDGMFKDIKIKAGQMLYLPPEVPHSPQRMEGSIGLVVEGRRIEGQLDTFLWYCQGCKEEVYRVSLELEDIEKQLPEAFEEFYSNTKNNTCKSCGKVTSKA